jgi:hypothetical protein
MDRRARDREGWPYQDPAVVFGARTEMGGKFGSLSLSVETFGLHHADYQFGGQKGVIGGSGVRPNRLPGPLQVFCRRARILFAVQSCTRTH